MAMAQIAPPATPAASVAGASCASNISALEDAITWIATYTNQSRTLLGPPLHEPGDPQQKAYETYNEHAAQFKKLAAGLSDPQAAPALAHVRAAYEKADQIDRFVVEYAESLGAFRSETNTTEGDPIDAHAPDANKHAKALQTETLERAELLRTALAEVWTALGPAKLTLAEAKRGCRP